MPEDWDPQEMEWRRRFARHLRAARERARLTQADVAEALGMTETVYARYERAKIWPGIGRLRQLCQILDCSADVLLGYQKLAPGAVPPAPPEEPLHLRRLQRQFRHARPDTVQAAHRVLDILERYGARSTSKADPEDSDDS
ncbi:MAG TPA: helix-turn-helix transcriptional regulator [Haliangium sp.]|nr:helix-turn-helix transcriptional regulator [Haliangium sp.]